MKRKTIGKIQLWMGVVLLITEIIGTFFFKTIFGSPETIIKIFLSLLFITQGLANMSTDGQGR